MTHAVGTPAVRCKHSASADVQMSVIGSDEDDEAQGETLGDAAADMHDVLGLGAGEFAALAAAGAMPAGTADEQLLKRLTHFCDSQSRLPCTCFHQSFPLGAAKSVDLHTSSVAELAGLEVMRRDFREPLGFNFDHVAHVFLRGVHEFRVQNPPWSFLRQA